MMGFFRKAQARAENSRFSGPADRVVYAIGDIHGCARELELLLHCIAADLSSHGRPGHLVFLGDYVDRGPNGAAVLDRLSGPDLPGQWQDFLLGNHEEAMLAVADGDRESLQGWLRFGGYETLASYGIDRTEALVLRDRIAERLRECVPPRHWDFLKRCKDQVRLGDYLFVHAGIRPGIPLDDQVPADLRWIRSAFLDDTDTDHGVMVVHGHTVSAQPEVRPNRIGVDTGCYRTGRLTALVVDGPSTRFLFSDGEITRDD